MKRKLEYITSIILLSLQLHSQLSKDTLIFSKYNFQLSAGSRLELISVGIERLGILKEGLSFGSQINLNGGTYNKYIGKQTIYNPLFLGVNVQPFHLLIGNHLQFETGPSASLNIYRFKGQQYPIDTSNNAYNLLRDNLILIYNIGCRYTFPEQKISFKLLFGAHYSTSLFNYNINRFFANGEISVLYRFRKKIYKKEYYNKINSGNSK